MGAGIGIQGGRRLKKMTVINLLAAPKALVLTGLRGGWDDIDSREGRQGINCQGAP